MLPLCLRKAAVAVPRFSTVANGHRINVLDELRAFLDNLRGPEPVLTKIRLVLRNNAIKIVHRQHCCGHPGEPGC